jgi:hypothetical protein
MKNIISKIRLTWVPIALASMFTFLFTQCNTDRHDLPKEFNILRFKVDGEKIEEPTKCGEWLSGCDPITTRHGVDRKGTLEFHGGGNDSNGYRNGVYVYIYKKFQLDTPLILMPPDELEYIYNKNTEIERYANLIDYHFMFTERNLEEGWIEGEFDFTVANDEGDTVKITDGYFKLTIDVY